MKDTPRLSARPLFGLAVPPSKCVAHRLPGEGNGQVPGEEQ